MSEQRAQSSRLPFERSSFSDSVNRVLDIANTLAIQANPDDPLLDSSCVLLGITEHGSRSLFDDAATFFTRSLPPTFGDLQRRKFPTVKFPLAASVGSISGPTVAPTQAAADLLVIANRYAQRTEAQSIHMRHLIAALLLAPEQLDSSQWLAELRVSRAALALSFLEWIGTLKGEPLHAWAEILSPRPTLLEVTIGDLSEGSKEILGHADAVRASHNGAALSVGDVVAGLFAYPKTRSRFGAAKIDEPHVRLLIGRSPYLAGGPAKTPLKIATMPPVEPTVAAILADALRRARARGGRRLRSQHLLAALLETDDPIAEALQLRGVRALSEDGSSEKAETVEVAATSTVSTAEEVTVFSTTSVTLPTTPSGWLAGYAADRADGTDSLRLADEVAALSSLLIAKSVAPPLSVGLFGEWGAGKSFFMNLMRDWIDQHARDSQRVGESRFCANVVQIEFNAWHYVDANLWASLVTRILEAMKAYDGSDRILSQLATVDELRKDIAVRKQEAEALQVVAQAKLEQARKAHALQVAQPHGGVQDTLKALLDDEKLSNALKDTARELGLRADDLDELRAKVEELDAVSPRLLAFWRWLGWGKLWVLLALACIPTLLLIALAHVQQFDGVLAWIRSVRHAAEVGMSLLLAASVSLTALLPRFRRVLTRIDGLRKRVDAVVAEKTKRLAESERRAAEELAQAEKKVQAIVVEQQEFDAGRKLYRFLEERAESSDYGKHLGLIALVRRDFERLSLLMKNAAGDSTTSFRRIDRIVLYIDDLDRCGVEQVANVLQAVHLLLAFPLFVVVVGVDPRWLLHSLERRYVALSGGESAQSSATTRSVWASTPHNFLEKIFQIPFALRPLEVAGFKQLVDDLTKEAPAASASSLTLVTNAPRAVPSPIVSPPQPSSSAGLDVTAAAEPTAASAAIEPLPLPSPVDVALSDGERALMGALAQLLATPRSVKRFVNLYRLLRAMAGAELASGKPYGVPMLLLAILVGFPAEAAQLFSDCTDGRSALSWLELVQTMPAEVLGRILPLLTAEPDLARIDLVDVRRWIPTVSRFSFECGQLNYSRAPVAAKATGSG